MEWRLLKHLYYDRGTIYDLIEIQLRIIFYFLCRRFMTFESSCFFFFFLLISLHYLCQVRPACPGVPTFNSVGKKPTQAIGTGYTFCIVFDVYPGVRPDGHPPYNMCRHKRLLQPLRILQWPIPGNAWLIYRRPWNMKLN